MLTKSIVVIVLQYKHYQNIILYTLNLYSVICQLHLNKARGEVFSIHKLKKNYAEWKDPVSKGYVQYDSIYMTFSK